jgi:hypothetical protein
MHVNFALGLRKRLITSTKLLGSAAGSASSRALYYIYA